MGDWVRELVERSGYAGIALLMLLETLFPPIPSEVVMPLAGVRAARGGPALWGVIVAGTAGAMAGNLGWYMLARALGLERFGRLLDRFGRYLTMDRRDLGRADAFFDRWNRWFVGFGRMVPTLRSLVSVPAGLFGMPLLPFLLCSTLGTAGWTAALAGAGYLLGRGDPGIDRYLGPAATAVLVALLGWYVYRVVTWKPRP